MKITDLQSLTIYTIGHGNRKIETLIGLLQQNNIGMVVDVRSIPYSRFHPQFRQQNLKNSLESANISYLWLGRELGGRPANPAMYNNGIINYDAIKKSVQFETGIRQVLELVRQGIKVTLTCSESDQNQCHRKHLISDELIDNGISVIHINKIGDLEEDN